MRNITQGPAHVKLYSLRRLPPPSPLFREIFVKFMTKQRCGIVVLPCSKNNFQIYLNLIYQVTSAGNILKNVMKGERWKVKGAPAWTYFHYVQISSKFEVTLAPAIVYRAWHFSRSDSQHCPLKLCLIKNELYIHMFLSGRRGGGQFGNWVFTILLIQFLKQRK